jgi:hypothetical protein
MTSGAAFAFREWHAAPTARKLSDACRSCKRSFSVGSRTRRRDASGPVGSGAPGAQLTTAVWLTLKRLAWALVFSYDAWNSAAESTPTAPLESESTLIDLANAIEAEKARTCTAFP